MNECAPGIHIPLVTPYNNGAPTHPNLAALIEWQISCGVDGFYVGGSTGEAFLMDERQRKAYLGEVSSIVKDRLPLMAHVGSIVSGEPIRLAKHAEKLGYTVLAATPPFYFRFGESEVYDYYVSLAEATSLPLVIYNIPSNSGYTFPLALLLRLLDHPKIVGIKHTSPDFFVVERVLSHRPDTTIYSGPDQLLCAGLAMGATGGIGSTYNILPDLYTRLYRLWKAGEHNAAFEIQHRVNTVTEAILEASPSGMPGIKAALALIGFDIGEARPPFKPLDAHGRDVIRASLDEIGWSPP